MPYPATNAANYEEWKRAYHGQLALRAKAGIAQKARAGGISGPAPLGYRNVHTLSGPTVEPDPERAPLVGLAFELLALPSTSLRSVLKELTLKGLTNRRGKPLSLSSLQHLATNPFYAGLVTLNKETYPGSHEPLVSLTLFQQVQAQLQKRRSYKIGHRSPDCNQE